MNDLPEEIQDALYGNWPKEVFRLNADGTYVGDPQVLEDVFEQGKKEAANERTREIAEWSETHRNKHYWSLGADLELRYPEAFTMQSGTNSSTEGNNE